MKGSKRGARKRDAAGSGRKAAAGRGKPRSYRLPSDEEALTAIYRAGARMKVIESQKVFIDMVRAELAALHPDYRIAPKRLRLLALKSGYLKVEVRTREEDRLSKKLRTCPVCGSRLGRIKNMTIYGGKITLGYNCRKCTYWTGARLRRPVRYIFTRTRSSKNGGRKVNGVQAIF